MSYVCLQTCHRTQFLSVFTIWAMLSASDQITQSIFLCKQVWTGPDYLSAFLLVHLHFIYKLANCHQAGASTKGTRWRQLKAYLPHLSVALWLPELVYCQFTLKTVHTGSAVVESESFQQEEAGYCTDIVDYVKCILSYAVHETIYRGFLHKTVLKCIWKINKQNWNELKHILTCSNLNLCTKMLRSYIGAWTQHSEIDHNISCHFSVRKTRVAVFGFCTGTSGTLLWTSSKASVLYVFVQICK